jgi:hypothetical protein
MSEKSKQLLENLKAITKKESNTDTEVINYRNIISNLGGDRIYGNVSGHVELINKNNSTYHGKINKRATREKGLDGNNFRSYVYETADNRWFDRLGLPIKKPTNLVGNNDTSEEESAIKIVKERTDNDADSVESSI